MHILFPYILIALAIFQFLLKKGSKDSEERTRAFWKRESDANSVRRKDISNLDYIHIPESLMSVTGNNPQTEDALEKFRSCAGTTMLNLSGLSNTDLKMAYGPANLESLSAYDENCTKLLRSIVSCAEALKEEGRDDEAAHFLEFGISCKTDLSSNYIMLADYYATTGNTDKINSLIESAGTINSISRDTIVKKLKTYIIKC